MMEPRHRNALKAVNCSRSLEVVVDFGWILGGVPNRSRRLRPGVGALVVTGDRPRFLRTTFCRISMSTLETGSVDMDLIRESWNDSGCLVVVIDIRLLASELERFS